MNLNRSAIIHRRITTLQHAFPYLPSSFASSSSSLASMSSTTASSSSSRRRLYQPHHVAARSHNSAYPSRMPVPDEKVDWSVQWAEYRPPTFTTDSTLKKSPDAKDPRDIAGLEQRKSFESSPLKMDSETGRPLNPYGRTGLAGRGKLYQWGPNHAADPIVTRNALNGGKSDLEVVLIQRGDTGASAFPGGMVDKGEEAVETAQREFSEEAMDVGESKKSAAQKLAQQIFGKDKGQVVYAGYIDDPRNTDNAWMESTCVWWHVSEDLSKQLDEFLKAGDDAKAVKWQSISKDDWENTLKGLYEGHKPIMKKVIDAWKTNENKL